MILIKSYPRGGGGGDVNGGDEWLSILHVSGAVLSPFANFFLSFTTTHMAATRMISILEEKKLRFRDRANKTEQRKSEMSVLAGGIQHGEPEMDGLLRC